MSKRKIITPLTEIEELISHGQYQKALEALESKEISKEVNIDQMRMTLHKIIIFSRTNKLYDALRLSNESIANFNTNKFVDDSLLFDLFFSKAATQMRMIFHEDSLKTLAQAEEILNKIDPESPEFIIRQAKLFYLRGSIISLKGDYDNGLELLEQTIPIFREYDDKIFLANCYSRIGAIHTDKGELKQAQYFLKESLKIFAELGNILDSTGPLNNLSVLYIQMGELDKALEYLEQHEKISQEANDLQRRITAINNRGEVFRMKGELEKASEAYLTGLQLAEKYKVNHVKSLFLGNLGIVHWQQNELEKAYLGLNDAITLDMETNSTQDLEEWLLYVIIVLIEMGDETSRKQAVSFLNQLKGIAHRENNRVYWQSARIADAVVCRSSSNFRQQMKAEFLLEQIIEEEIVSHERTVMASIILTEFLLEDLLKWGNSEDFEEIRKQTGNLQFIAEQQHSHWLLAETYCLQAKLALIEGSDITQARRLLSWAQQLAEVKGLKRLAMKISSDHDHLLLELEKWKNLDQDKITLSERAELAQIDMKKIIKKQSLVLEDQEGETPTLLLILSEGGLCVFAYNFSKVKLKESQLIAGLLTAINTFTAEVFEYSLDRAKFGKYNLVMKPLNTFLICYVFEGSSYPATLKIDHFLNALVRNPPLLKTIVECDVRKRELVGEKRKDLDKMVVEIFTVN